MGQQRDSVSSSILPSVNHTSIPSRISPPDINRAAEIFTQTEWEAIGRVPLGEVAGKCPR